MRLVIAVMIAVMAVISIGQGPAGAEDMVDYCAIPPFISAKGPPLVMLVISREHKLFMEAYTDYSDIDENGTIDTTYNDAIDYYGYFDPEKTYSYDGSKFVPEGSTIPNTHKKPNPSSSYWSGNFLNWATMSRIDTIRKVLYGGKRCVDDPGLTVLERASIPTDAHSWVKVYPGNPSDFADSKYTGTITLGNTTLTSGGLPLLRVATGNESTGTDGWPRWAANERWQCVNRGKGGDTQDFKIPPTTDIDDYTVRVQVAVDGKLGTEKVKKYGDDYKPIGLLQEHGEDDTIYFGLITGSYRKNKSGGVLRRNITSFSSEVTAATGEFTAVSGIVKNLDEIEIADYQYGDGTYGSACDYGLYSFSDDQCRSWGNPIGEIYYEALRYYAGVGATSAYAADDSSYGLTTETWVDPYSVYPWCSPPNILVITDENPSFDSIDEGVGLNEYFGSGDIGISSVTALTNAIDEVSASVQYFIGNNGSTNDNQCTPKTISGLGAVYGLCQEEPRREGSYHIAGLAHYAKTHDMSDTADNAQKITTYSVVLNTKLPEIIIPVGGSPVKLVPACRTYSRDNPHLIINGALVDFRVISQDSDSGKFYVNWENSEQGSDFDQDCDGYLTYQVNGSQITVTAQITSHSASRRFDFGYILSGTQGTDGLHLVVDSCDDCDHRYDAPTTPYNYKFFGDAYTDPADEDQNPMLEAYQPLAPSECGDINTYKTAWQFLFSSDTYTAGSTADQLLKDPLWYAAKWGGFNDIDGDNIPDDDPNEWDRDGDDNPDTYFYVQNPAKLEKELNKALGEILRRTSSGTAVSVLSTSAGGEGALFQAYFNPSVYDIDPVTGGVSEVNWVGYLNALWVDQYGNLREDTGSGGNPDQHLVLTQDPIIVFDLDEDGDTVVKKYADADGDGEIDDPNTPSTYPLFGLQPIWEGGKKLTELDASLRQISTFINEDGLGTVPETDEWDKNNFTTTNLAKLTPLLDASDPTDIINFIRGGNCTTIACRDRTLDGVTWKLGDIVYSTPTVVGRPMENYHLTYGDTTYLDYVRMYKDRETMIYVGGNDGMLHAFSAGTYHEGNDSTTGDTDKGWYDGTCGKELWAYIPYNLLPQLKWLCDSGYCHAYYVDLKAKVVDARIFPTTGDPNHPNGWGTVLIGAMRLGGKEITANGQTFRSAYFAIDITVPDTPDLLWEFTDGNLNFTTSYPAVFRVGTVKPFATKTGDWYVIFGSGPTTFEGAGAATGYVYVRKLSDGTPARTFTVDVGVGNPVFMASPITIDLGLDYQVDVAYIGASYKEGETWKGKIFRIKIDESTTAASWTWSPFVSFDQPITIAPAAALDPYNRLWLYWGTGRFFSGPDKTDTTTQRLYGVWDPGTEVLATGDPPAKLKDVTEIKVYERGYMVDVTPTTFNGYLAARRANYNAESLYGWYLKMTSPIALDGERAINNPTVLGDIVLFPTFKPEADVCSFGGTSYLYALYYETGTAYWKSIIGVDEADEVDDNYRVLKKAELGAGMPTSVVVHAGQEEGVKGMVQLGTGVVKVLEIDPASSPQSKVLFWREKTD